MIIIKKWKSKITCISIINDNNIKHLHFDNSLLR